MVNQPMLDPVKVGFHPVGTTLEAQPKPWKNQDRFVSNLLRIERSVTPKRYRGWVTCACCQKKIGHVEFTWMNFTWRSDLMHTVLDHNIRPDNEDFIRAVLDYGKNTKRA